MLFMIQSLKSHSIIFTSLSDIQGEQNYALSFEEFRNICGQIFKLLNLASLVTENIYEVFKEKVQQLLI